MASLSLGIVGAGRTRNGLGPLLATFAEGAGFRVTAIAGRSPQRAIENAAALGTRLGHSVTACPDVDSLCRSGIAALLIASPPIHHLEALEAAVRARLPALCEKPLVHESQAAAGAAVVQAFASASQPLMENCQWPFVLPALRGVWRTSPDLLPSRVELGLAAPRPGREMVQNSLSHLLSVVQALVPIGADTTVRRVALTPAELDGRPATLRFDLVGPSGVVEAALHLRLCPTGPRPAWIEIDGTRMDRTVGRDGALWFEGHPARVRVAEPMRQLVCRFAELVRAPERSRLPVEVGLVRQRLRLYQSVLGALP